MKKLCTNWAWIWAKNDKDDPKNKDDGRLWAIASTKNHYHSNLISQMRVLNRHDPLETQRMLDMAG